METELCIDICICTFRRPHIAQTLASLSQLAMRPTWKLRIIVADNDELPAARERVESAGRACLLDLTYLHAPARNISVARNACLEAVTSPFYAFIDDDEMASPGWLDALVTAAMRENADIVLGPVKAVYPKNCPAWMRRGDFHSAKPVWTHGEIRTGYSCNVLVRTSSPALQGLRFRPEFGRSGGEDTIFFAAAFKAGAKFAYAPGAVVTEAVTAERAQFAWLLKRYFRAGQTHGVLLQEAQAAPRGAQLLRAFLKAFFCAGAAFACLLFPVRQRYWLLRGTLHFGVMMRLMGKREIIQYG